MPPAGGETTPPIFFPEKENGRRPSKRKAFALQASSLKSCGACRIECLLFLLLYDLTFFYLRCRFACDSLALRNFRLLRMLSDLQVPAKAALLRSPRLLELSVDSD